MTSILVIGGNSLIGQHLIKELLKREEKNSVEIRVFEYYKEFVSRIEMGKKCNDIVKFTGEENLNKALDEITTVFNLHEIQDFSVLPDKNLMRAEDVDALKRLLDACTTCNVSKFIHLSSYYVQSSNWWPNVNCPEIAQIPPRSQCPYPDYVDVKLESEHLVLNADNLQSLIVRAGPVYGEGDECSLILDAVKMARVSPYGCLLVIGDRNNALQLTYAGNVAAGMMIGMDKLEENGKLTKETVFLLDDTPVRDLYALLEPLLRSRTPIFYSWHLPFILFFFPYVIISWLVSKVGRFVHLPDRLRRLPSFYFMYMLLYQWTFFSPNKSRLLLDFVPPYSFENSMELSSKYYENVDITSFPYQPSWLCSTL